MQKIISNRDNPKAYDPLVRIWPLGKSIEEVNAAKAASFIIVRYVRVLYDDFGNIYRYVTLGYNFW